MQILALMMLDDRVSVNVYLEIVKKKPLQEFCIFILYCVGIKKCFLFLFFFFTSKLELLRHVVGQM